MKLINRYKVILKKKKDTSSKISNIKSVELMIELLEVIIIWQISELRWFVNTIVEQPLPTRIEIVVEFAINYKPVL